MSEVARYGFEAKVLADVDEELGLAVRNVLDALVALEETDSDAGQALTRALANLHTAMMTLEGNAQPQLGGDS